MCTAITYKTKNHYFGRNLDLEYSYNEEITIMPRNFPLEFRHMPPLRNHYALIGMSYVADGYPLYYDATNEKGLSMAGLNFPEDTEYKPFSTGFDNIAPFEFIPWILCQCENLEQVKILLSRTNLIAENFSSQLPCTPLHWMISDPSGSIVVESLKEGLRIHENPAGVLTNSPAFEIQMWNLRRSSHEMNVPGIPGDLSSVSRFVRASSVREHSVSDDSEESSVSQFFHILGSAAMPRGCVPVAEKYQYTRYSSCCNTDLGIYYYTTYENSRITAVDMHLENLESDQLLTWPLITESQILFQNSCKENADA
ncbi:MAG: choloylglycine hydrolase family protein [Firmicutes bacterium]|nr:choloylglycine hydrolase family protein [Bacillota bacterium]